MSPTPLEPSDWIVRWAHLVAPNGPILDLACGGGRHARWFLERGRAVVAVDRDLSGVADLEGRPGAELLQADLESDGPWPLAGCRFSAVVVTNYLFRPRFDELVAAVAPGGALLYDTFALGNERFGRPRNPDFLLRPGELIERVAGRLTIVAYEHGSVRTPRTAVVQRLAAVRSELGSLDGTD